MGPGAVDRGEEEWEVRLTVGEAGIVGMIGACRNASAKAKGRGDRYGAKGEGWDLHMLGALGEFAASKELGRYWHWNIGGVGGPDLAGNIQIRTRPKPEDREHWDLIIRDNDDPSARYVLVEASGLDFTLLGWIYGHEAQRPEWRGNLRGTTDVWFVPASALHPVSELK